MKANTQYWILAILITLSAVFYQRLTGPTNPKRVKFELAGKEYSTKLPRSLETSVTLSEAQNDYESLGKKSLMEIVVPESPKEMNVIVYYRIYPGNDTIRTIAASKSGDIYSVILPSQPPAGKLAYFVEFNDGYQAITLGMRQNVIIRFKSPVPPYVLVPHILLMFLAMLISTFAGILAFTKSTKTAKYALIVIITLGIGGLILGPVVQKYAFGAFWTGWPFGEDLTDNKTLVAFLFWLTAWLINRKKSRKWLYILAAVVMLMVYSIPHSTAGSEYNHEKGSIETGN
ncbi:MAG: hypothetical protein WC833_09410 [Bacteroidales bacterium]|jgi:hypothetical protein